MFCLDLWDPANVWIWGPYLFTKGALGSKWASCIRPVWMCLKLSPNYAKRLKLCQMCGTQMGPTFYSL